MLMPGNGYNKRDKIQAKPDKTEHKTESVEKSKTGRAFIDVFEGELTLCVGKEAITFNLNQTSRYSANYNDMTANHIDVIDMACEEYSQEVLGFSDVIASGNPTPYYDPIVSTTSPTLTPFENSDFLFEEVDAFLSIEDDPTSPEELKICEAKTNKSSIDEPPEVELKDLPSHLENAFLEGHNKLPVIIVKNLSVEEKTALITVLKSHKRAITWKLSDIKGIDPEFCTHKILMEEDFEPAVQHQRRVNLKIHNVIKQEVLKLLDAGLKYPISDSPWPSTLRNQYYCFLDGFSRYFQIPINPKDQEKNTFTCPHGMFAYLRMPFGLCNAPGTFQRKPLTFLRLATMDPLGETMAQITQPRRFGTPRAIISDRGTHFCNDQFAKVMLKFGVSHRLATSYHPQTSGHVEVSIRGLKRILKRTVGKTHASWSDKLDDAL
uniref:Reverse transcriptase domain-containing protein n=1 Tax=Tanacetum cinerariifolium TaxID=118510 RepID=A0A6L2KLM8_TANCI|nr:reverse transcriptase domain-containing protein [Tanacetum cinerariifolium]